MTMVHGMVHSKLKGCYIRFVRKEAHPDSLFRLSGAMHAVV